MPRNFANISLLPLFEIIAQFTAMKWRKRKQSMRKIPRHGIPIGNPGIVSLS